MNRSTSFKMRSLLLLAVGVGVRGCCVDGTVYGHPTPSCRPERRPRSVVSAYYKKIVVARACRGDNLLLVVAGCLAEWSLAVW